MVEIESSYCSKAVGSRLQQPDYLYMPTTSCRPKWMFQCNRCCHRCRSREQSHLTQHRRMPLHNDGDCCCNVTLPLSISSSYCSNAVSSSLQQLPYLYMPTTSCRPKWMFQCNRCCYRCRSRERSHLTQHRRMPLHNDGDCYSVILALSISTSRE
jgi:hypothetical protein